MLDKLIRTLCWPISGFHHELVLFYDSGMTYTCIHVFENRSIHSAIFTTFTNPSLIIGNLSLRIRLINQSIPRTLFVLNYKSALLTSSSKLDVILKVSGVSTLTNLESLDISTFSRRFTVSRNISMNSPSGFRNAQGVRRFLPTFKTNFYSFPNGLPL